VLHPSVRSALIGSISQGVRRASIIIPTHNGGHLLVSCLDSIYRSNLAQTLDVIVVDNASTDNSSEVLTRYPEVIVVRNERNVGFAHACNQGADQITRSDILIFLNNDTYSSGNWLAHLLACFDAPDVSVVGAVLHYANGFVQHAGVHFNARGIPHNMRVIAPSEDMPPYDVQAVTGACLAVRRDHFIHVGGFDTRYLNSFEDIDLCIKIRRTGGRVQLAPRARLTHLESQTPGRHDFDQHNRQLFLATWGESVLPDVSRVRARAEDLHRIASVIPLPTNATACPHKLPPGWEWIAPSSTGATSTSPRQVLERATGDCLVFLDCSTYRDFEWPDLARASMAAKEFLVAQTPTGCAFGILLPRALAEEIGLPNRIDLSSLLGRIANFSGAHAATEVGSSTLWRTYRAVLDHLRWPG